MLNYNKIHSDINAKNVFLTEIARFGKIPYTSLKDRFERERLYAFEIEIIADYFSRPISYYFDREETEAKPYKQIEVKMDIDEESCAMCREKDAEINKLKTELIEAQKETITILRGEKKITQSNCG